MAMMETRTPWVMAPIRNSPPREKRRKSAPAQGDAEEISPHGDRKGNVDHADAKVGDELPENKLGFADRGGDELFHGPPLPFPGRRCPR